MLSTICEVHNCICMNVYDWLYADQIFHSKEERTQYGVSLPNPLSVILLYKKVSHLTVKK